MAAISTSRCEFTQFVTDHFVGNKYRNVLTTIMDSDGQTDHVRKDR
ncbi:30S ribosomal protein S19 [Kosakonia radicincitans UMEnt01/12]|nr:30S ribosomal protein S19 [Kosakonia radicincitans UMEnt01/12]